MPPIISATGRAMNFKFGRYIQRVHPKKTIKNVGKKGVWAYPGTAENQNFWLPLLAQERVKLRTSNFVRIFIASIGTKAHYKNSGKVAVGVLRGSRKFLRHPYRAHRAVVFAIP